MDTAGRAEHWDSAYQTKTPAGVSWYQPEASVSLRLIGSLGLPSDVPIIDVGGGASVLVDGLLDSGFTDVTVLDLSQDALDASRRRLGDRASAVHWLREDLLRWKTPRRYAVWHDRAFYHFLIDPADRRRYADVLSSALAKDGSVVVATFAPDGPDQCSGLPAARYAAPDLAKELGLELVASDREEHVTPGGGIQLFTWLVARRSEPEP